MKIRKCPGCAQLIHCDAHQNRVRCWNCARLSEVAPLATAEEKFGRTSLAAFDRALPHPSRLVRVARIALVVAAPVAALMLLIGNGFDLAIVRDAAAPFVMR